MRGTLAIVAVLLFTAPAAAFPRLLSLGPPHTASRSRAKIDSALTMELAVAVRTRPPATVEDAIRLGLSLSGQHLHFGLGHRMDLRFGTDERVAHCIEYAHLLAGLLDRIARVTKLAMRAFAVHSATARFIGERVPLRGFGDHDWVLVEAGGKRWFVDPTLDDAGLGWDISASVVEPGKVRLPR